MKGLVTHKYNNTKLYIQPEDRSDDLNSVAKCLKKTHLLQIPTSLNENDVLLVPFNGEFYRAKIIEFRINTVVVVFPDYGNEQEIKQEDIRSPHPLEMACCFSVAPIAVAVECLPPVPSIDPNDTIEFTVQGKFENNCLLVQVNSVFKNTNGAPKLDENTLPCATIEHDEESIEVIGMNGAKLLGTVSHVDIENSLIFIIPNQNAAKVERIQLKLNNLAKPRPVSASLLNSKSIYCSIYDDCYYRCKIVNPKSPNSILVEFIDFGNQEVVQEVFDVSSDRELCTYGPMCLKIFREPYFYGMLVDDDTPNLQLQASIDIDDEPIWIAQEVGKRNFPIPVAHNEGDVLHARVTYVPPVNNPRAKVLYVADVKEADTYLPEMDDLLEEMSPSLNGPLHCGVICKSPYEGTFYRSVIVECEESKETVSVYFVDFGNVETVLKSELFCLDPRLHLFPPLAMKVTFHSLKCSKAEEDDLTLTLTKRRGLLDWFGLCHEDGLCLSREKLPVPFINKFEGPIRKPIFHPPVRVKEKVGSIIDGMVVHACDDDHVVFIQRFDEKSTSMELQTILNEESSMCPADFLLDVGVYCKAYFDEDYYRAVITGKEENNSWLVEFIDYGNFETVSSDKIFFLKDHLITSYPKLVVKCKLTNSDYSSVNYDHIAVKLIELEDDTWLTNVFSKSNACPTEIMPNGHNISSCAVANGSGDIPTAVMSVRKSFSPKVHDHLSGCVTFINKDEDVIFVIPNENNNIVTRIQHILNDQHGNNNRQFPPCKIGFIGSNVGQIFGAIYDDCYYRCKVIHVKDSSHILVEFIDFGNQEVVQEVIDISSDPELCLYSPMCLKLFREPHFYGISVDDDTPNLQLQASIHIISEPIWIAREVGKRYFPIPVAHNEGDVLHARVTYVPPVNNPRTKVLYVADVKEADTYLPEMDDLLEKMSPSLNGPLHCGVLCKSPYEGIFYRSVIVECEESKETVSVYFVDFGNVEMVRKNDIMQLDSALLKYPPLAMKVTYVADINELQNTKEEDELEVRLLQRTGLCDWRGALFSKHDMSGSSKLNSSNSSVSLNGSFSSQGKFETDFSRTVNPKFEVSKSGFKSNSSLKCYSLDYLKEIRAAMKEVTNPFKVTLQEIMQNKTPAKKADFQNSYAILEHLFLSTDSDIILPVQLEIGLVYVISSSAENSDEKDYYRCVIKFVDGENAVVGMFDVNNQSVFTSKRNLMPLISSFRAAILL